MYLNCKFLVSKYWLKIYIEDTIKQLKKLLRKVEVLLSGLQTQVQLDRLSFIKPQHQARLIKIRIQTLKSMAHDD